MNTNMYLSTCCVQALDFFVWGLLPCVSHFHLERLRRDSSEIFLRAHTPQTSPSPHRALAQKSQGMRLRQTKTMTWQDSGAQPNGPLPMCPLITTRISTYMGTGASVSSPSGPNWIFIIKKAVVLVVVVVGCYSLGKQQGDSQNHFSALCKQSARRWGLFSRVCLKLSFCFPYSFLCCAERREGIKLHI